LRIVVVFIQAVFRGVEKIRIGKNTERGDGASAVVFTIRLFGLE